MRIILLIIVSVFLCSPLFSQKDDRLEEIKSDIYYEREATAIQKLCLLSDTDLSQPDAAYLLIELLLNKSKLDSAELVLNKALQFAENSGFKKKAYSNLLVSKARLMMEKGMIKEAREEMETLLRNNKYKNVSDLIAVSKAQMESRNGDVKWAIELLEKAKAREPRNAEIFMLLGDAYRKSIEGGLAISNFDKVCSLVPQLAEPYFKKGMIYKTQDAPDIYLKLFQKAYQVDSNYSPVLYQLYDFYFLRDAGLAEYYLMKYISNSDYDPKFEYMIADVKYRANKYKEAISVAQQIMERDGLNIQPRLFKLIGYSYLELGDSLQAYNFIINYFEKQHAEDLVAKDFEIRAVLAEKLKEDKNDAIEWYKKALMFDNTGKDSVNYMVKLANLEKQLGRRAEESYWRGQICRKKTAPSNLDIYEWGVSLYFSKSYLLADSVFSVYEEKYPEQLHGYLWRARSNAAIDTSMELGLAVPHYTKFIELAERDSEKNKALLLRAYQYLGAYEANIEKNYLVSKDYYNKVLLLNPSDTEADKNIKLLEKLMEESKGDTDK